MGSHAPYGYKKSDEDKHKLVIDDDAASIVRFIFKEYASGVNGRMIADKLNTRGVLCPRAYRYLCLGRENPKKETDKWGSGSIMLIITNRVYLGHLEQGKRKNVSFKSKKRCVVDSSNWIVVENTHEPIICQELWDEVQYVKQKSMRCHKPKVERQISIFAGLVQCPDCGSSMAASYRGRKGKEKMTYRCCGYSNKGKEVCTSHNVREEVLEAVVLNDIQKFAYLATVERDSLIQKIVKATQSKAEANGNMTAKQLREVKRKLDENRVMVKNLYQDKVSGKMPEDFFYSLLADYEKDKADLEDKLLTLKEQEREERRSIQNSESLVDKVASYLNIKAMDRNIARQLIDKITVSAYYKVDGVNTQDITIYYKFVGNLDKVFGGNENIA